MQGERLPVRIRKVELSQGCYPTIPCRLDYCDPLRLTGALRCKRTFLSRLFNIGNQPQGLLIMGTFGTSAGHVGFQSRLGLVEVG